MSTNRGRPWLSWAALAALPSPAGAFAPQGESQEPDPFAPFVAERSAEAEQRLSSFKLPAGWKVELVAAEPLLANPVCFAFDHDGKTVYVGETFRHHKGVTDIRDHMDWNDDDLAARTVEDRVAYFKKHLGERFPEFERACERVRRLTDDDGDGLLDRATVFSDRFRDAAAGIGASLLSYRGDVFYTCIPSLWRLRDGNGDGRADVEEELSTGYGVHVALLGHDLHGLRIGPDGKLYFSVGDRGLNVPLPSGTRMEYPEAGAVLRCELDGSGLELFATGLRNPQDLVFDAFGNLFTGDNNSDGGDLARLVHVVEGSDSGWRQAYQWINEPDVRGPWNDEKQWHPYPDNQVAAILPPIANLSDGPSGLSIDPGTGLPAQYSGWFFLADFRGGAQYSGVRGFELLPHGAGFQLGRHDETWWGVLATDVELGPDGAMYVLDWTEGWNQTGKGRIWRAYDPEARGAFATREAARLLREGFDRRPENELAGLLSHADQRVRQEAQFALVRRGAAGRSRLEQAALSSKSRLARVHGIWGLGMLLREKGARGALWLAPLLEDADSEVRAQAARVLGDLREPGAVQGLVKRLRDAEPRVRMYAALGLARVKAAGVGRELIEFAAAPGEADPVLAHCASLAFGACFQSAELAGLADHDSEAVRLAAVVGLRRQGSPEVQRFLADSDPAVVLEAARAIYDVPITAALEPLAALLNARGDEYALQRRAINANFRLGTRAHAARVAEFAARGDVSARLREEALLRLGQWAKPSSRDTVVGAWRPLPERDAAVAAAVGEALLSLGESLALREEPTLARQWVQSAVLLRLGTAAPRLAAWASDETRPAMVRAEAIRGLAQLDSAELGAALRAGIASGDRDVRAEALEHLPRIEPAQALSLALQVLESGGLRERRAALSVLAKLPTPAASAALADLLRRQTAGLVAPELALDLARAAEKKQDGGVPELLRALRAPRDLEPLLAEYVDSLHGGDAERGKRIFREKSETACLRCHQAAGEGGLVGPALDGLKDRATRADLLVSLCDPNRTIAAGFRSTILFLKDDTRLEGRVLSEDEKTLHLIDAAAKQHEIDVAEIEERREGQSSMPTDLTRFLTREEMRDLIEFLWSL
ncbi:MAG: HEAT repeat domain-containing protein [Planctomycetes bacterium]|nr:HEAT repeat domain-containing protein [Planctomycetota bacterium]